MRGLGDLRRHFAVPMLVKVQHSVGLYCGAAPGSDWPLDASGWCHMDRLLWYSLKRREFLLVAAGTAPPMIATATVCNREMTSQIVLRPYLCLSSLAHPYDPRLWASSVRT